MLTNKQELDLIERLPLQPQDRWLALLYRAKCKKVNREMHTQLGKLGSCRSTWSRMLPGQQGTEQSGHAAALQIVHASCTTAC